ncbi:MAG: YdcF family protein, partial [Oscillospiraceae bacterium]|nr:YdcF family protein [Oscillospiraceae bacterium]
GADYVILLGTQMRASGPSVDFRARIESAYEYLTENPESMLIATGGKGGNEPVSEAEGARDYLVRKGIEEDRVILEDKSTNTAENLEFSARILRQLGEDLSTVKVVIVSADYHLCRASYIAEKVGFGDVSCRGSHGLVILLPHFYTRDLIALIKEHIVYGVIPVLTGRPAVPEPAPAA